MYNTPIIMKLIFNLIFLLIPTLTFCQDHFKLGIENFKKGNFLLAEYLFTQQLNENPKDNNVRFNRGLTRLALNDTCAACIDLGIVYHHYNDKEAAKLYWSFCSKSDTLYYDNDFKLTYNRKFRFYEIIEQKRCEKFLFGEIHDKRNKNASIIIGSDITNFRESNIIATYIDYNDSTRIYTFTLTPPSEYKDDDFRLESIHNNQYYIEARKELNLSHVIVYVEYIVNKMGTVEDIKITDINKELECKEELTNFCKSILSTMPPYKPAKFRDKNVDYIMVSSLSFW